MKRTPLRVKGVSSQTEHAAADVTAEALSVEEEALGTEPLHHVHPLGAEVADVAAAEPRGGVPAPHALRGRGQERRVRVKFPHSGWVFPQQQLLHEARGFIQDLCKLNLPWRLHLSIIYQ